MQNTQIQQGQRGVSWPNPAFSIYERWVEAFLGHLLSHAHLKQQHCQAQSLAVLLCYSPALLLWACCGTEIHTYTSCRGVKVLKDTIRPCGGSQSGHCTHICTAPSECPCMVLHQHSTSTSSFGHLLEDIHIDKFCAFRQDWNGEDWSHLILNDWSSVLVRFMVIGELPLLAWGHPCYQAISLCVSKVHKWWPNYLSVAAGLWYLAGRSCNTLALRSRH